MGNKRQGAALAIIIGVIMAGLGAWAWGGGLTSARSDGGDGPVTSVTAIPATPAARDALPGDIPPNHVDNRGQLRPRELSAETRRLLEAKAAEIKPVLERSRSPLSAAKVEEAIVGLGYQADSVYTEYLRPTPEAEVVVFGISTSGGCVNGDVRVDAVRIVVDGLIPEWGCRQPKTH